MRFFFPPSHLLLKGKTPKTGSFVSVVFRTDCTSEVLKVETFSGSCQSDGLSMRARFALSSVKSAKTAAQRSHWGNKGKEARGRSLGGGGRTPVRDAGGNGKKGFQRVGFFWRISRLFKSLTIETTSPSHWNDFDIFCINFNCFFIFIMKNRKVI